MFEGIKSFCTAVPDPIVEVLKKAASVGIAGHISPDPDSLGACIALKDVLLTLGVPEVAIFKPPEGLGPQMQRILDGLGKLSGVDYVFVDPSPVEVFVGLDCCSLERLKIQPAELGWTPKHTFFIDHHADAVPEEESVLWKDSSASSTCEMIAGKFFDDLSFQGLNASMLGILGDTGRFAFPNTTSRTLRLAARMCEQGVSITDLVELLEDEPVLGSLWAILLGEVGMHVKHVRPGKKIVSFYNKKDLDPDIVPKELDIVRSIARKDPTAEVVYWRLITEVGIRVSMRSRKADVGAVARMFGGGGHRLAAGATLNSADQISHLESALTWAIIDAERETSQ